MEENVKVNYEAEKSKNYVKDKQLYTEMGKRLRKFRREKDYTQEEMAEILEISSAYYGKVERGVNSLSVKKLQLLNRELGIDINYLITGKESSIFLFENFLINCPSEKRFDFEQMIKHAKNLL